MEKIFDFAYDLLLLAGVIAGLYGIGFESATLKWIGAILVFGMPTITTPVERGLEVNDAGFRTSHISYDSCNNPVK